MAALMSDNAVKAKTGKVWNDWFKVIDKAGGKKMNHKEIVAYLKDNFDLNGWWQQMVTVEYEQVRGLRKKHENPQGFQISKSKTFAIPVDKLFNAVKDKRIRNKWLADPDIKFSTINVNKNLRAKWIDGKSRIEFQFYPKDKNKTQLVAQHNQLKNSTQAEKMKTYWNENLIKLNKIFK